MTITEKLKILRRKERNLEENIQRTSEANDFTLQWVDDLREMIIQLDGIQASIMDLESQLPVRIGMGHMFKAMQMKGFGYDEIKAMVAAMQTGDFSRIEWDTDCYSDEMKGW